MRLQQGVLAMHKRHPAGNHVSADTKASRSLTDSGHTEMTTQSPQYLRSDQCVQQMLVRLVGTYEPHGPVRKPALKPLKVAAKQTQKSL